MNKKLWQVIAIMIKTKDEREFSSALKIFERKIERLLSFFLIFLGGVLVLSAFRLISCPDTIFRIVFGLVIIVLAIMLLREHQS